MAGWGWAIAAVGEIPAFALLSRYMNRYHEMALLGVVSILYTIRWLLYGWITDPTALMFMQMMHSFTFAIFWIVALQYAVRLVPEEMRSTGLALFQQFF